jgi:hypothetical protein
MRDISNSDNVIDTRQILERIEDLESERKPWVAGYNMPGYMPDSEPATFSDYESACNYIAARIEEEIESLHESKDGVGPDIANGVDDTIAKLDAAIAHINKMADDPKEPEYGETIGNYHYWIAKAIGPQAFDDESDYDEWKALTDLRDECETYTSEMNHGEPLIRYSYWEDYCQEMLEDIGELPKELPGYIVIDWRATAKNIAMDYGTVNYDGVEYYIRSN